MRILKIIPLVATFLVLTLSSCSTNLHTQTSTSKKMPPGQAKKINGDKSAKGYAPGQQKKR